MSIHIEIVTPERKLVADDVDMISLPGEDGQMGILGGHAPLLTTLGIGEIVLHKGGNAEYMAVAGGVVEVRPDKVTVLADVAEYADEIDVERAEAARERARQSLAEGVPSERRPVMEAALRRSNLRLKIAHRRSRRRRERPDFEGG
ncbi:MAG: F0F1 ATP synthase subunit epsilon [Caldilineaceae bacterium]|nr:F0F1 ATP synthase subunit epsilon [Caldilineaceae bacterium]MCB9138373.1 F0F1 ATP synthase subunit epsilon [Caldilineaceae bacterium]